jgi:hypothetical protein
MNVNYELRRIWKKTVVACFKVLSQYKPGGTEENHEALSRYNSSPD